MLHFIRKIIFDTSPLSQYLPIIKQTKDQKIIRLLRDLSNPHSYEFQLHQQKINKSLIKRLLFSNMPVMNPISQHMLYWYIIMMIAILYNYVEFGIVLTYSGAWEGQLNTPLTLFFSIFTIVLLLADIIIKLNTGFLTRGMIILDRKRVVKTYLRGVFIFDFTYLIFLILCLATGSYSLNYTKFLWIAKLIRLSQIDDYFMRRFNVKRIKKTVHVILKLSFIILVLSHVIGIFFYVIDYYIYVNNIFANAYCWIYNSTAYSPIIQLSWAWQYYYTLYWGINTITTISYGDIQAGNPWEVIYGTACMCFGFMVYGYVVNQIIKVILWSKQNSDRLKADMLVMDVYMDNLKVPLKIQNQIRNHLRFLHKQEKNRNLQLQLKMRDKLPQDLKFQLVSNAYQSMNQKIINIFQSSTATKFLFDLVETKYTFNEQVSNQGQRALVLNFLHKGKIEYIVSCYQKQFSIYESQSQNEFLGHYQFFARKRWPFSIVSKIGSTVYSIDRLKMFEKINTIQVLRQRYKQVEYEVIFKQNLNRIYHTCYFCKVTHDWRKCPSKFPIIKSSFRAIHNVQNDGIRIIRRKYHTLNDYKKLQVMKPIQNTSNKKLTNLIEKRIAKIKEKINEKNEALQVDIAYDWKYFDINENLSKKRQFWNQKMIGKFSKLKKSMRDQKIMDQSQISKFQQDEVKSLITSRAGKYDEDYDNRSIIISQISKEQIKNE